MHPLQVTSVRLHDEQVLYVILENVARDDRDAGQTAAVHRSNYRTLHRRYPDLWTDLRSQTVTALGAFVADLPPAVVDLLYRLQHEHPVLDQHDWPQPPRRMWQSCCQVQATMLSGWRTSSTNG
ncbi:hypothetical protein GCM10009827_118940 [Dactylosporangium maewongense]|uniref:Mutator family transposase n=1 Tax=Dactylosporangium maewongense TaxID=634393 RepID=A0ABN2DJG8_9ACTN